MNGASYSLRQFRESDYFAFAAILSAVEPEEPQSPETLRHVVETLRLTAKTHELVAEDRRSGEVVAVGALFELPEEGDPKLQGIMVSVLPARQRAGIGTALFEALIKEAVARGATRLRCRVQASSAAGVAFVAKRGFRERRRRWRSRLEVASADTVQLGSLITSLESVGIQVTTLSREGANDLQVLERVYDLDCVAGKDVPRDGAFTPCSFEHYRRIYLAGETFLPEAWFLAKHGDQYVGMSVGAREPAQPQVFQQNFTGVRPEYRRRKVALTLKLALIEFARRSGYSRIETWNDSLNAPMWTLNKGLGFRKVREMLQLERDLP